MDLPGKQIGHNDFPGWGGEDEDFRSEPLFPL